MSVFSNCTPGPARRRGELNLPHGFRTWSSHAEMLHEAAQWEWEWAAEHAFEAQLLTWPEKQLAGFCASCRSPQQFRFEGISTEDPNWRETLACESCGLINRWRLAIHFLELLHRPAGPIYITERTTPLYQRLADEIPSLIGSEFFAPELSPGDLFDWNEQQLRHEDVTRLSFEDDSLAALMSFDVLEHVPDYRQAVREFGRVLAPGGLLLLSVPFDIRAGATVVRAKLAADGSIEHLLPASYHGDPLSDEGVLCYQDFGWDLLDELRLAGIESPRLVTCWSPAYGYLGFAQLLIVGWKRLPD